MRNAIWRFSLGIFAVGMCAMWAAPASAQSDIKEKPPLYTYVSFWTIPRGGWTEMDKQTVTDQKTLQQAFANGTIVGYGDDKTMVHTADGATHDEWWSAMSMAGLMNVLDQFMTNGTATTPVLESSTAHWDAMLVSHYYNWKPGTIRGGYEHVSYYKLKDGAAHDSIELLAKNWIVPHMEKLLADGTITEYEIDTEAIHTQAPGGFWIVFLTPTADGLDKWQGALSAAGKDNPLAGPAFGSVIDTSAHRDDLARANATFK